MIIIFITTYNTSALLLAARVSVFKIKEKNSGEEFVVHWLLYTDYYVLQSKLKAMSVVSHDVGV